MLFKTSSIFFIQFDVSRDSAEEGWTIRGEQDELEGVQVCSPGCFQASTLRTKSGINKVEIQLDVIWVDTQSDFPDLD